MDSLRFDEIIKQIKSGGFPNIENEAFNQNQKKEIIDIIKDRLKRSSDYIKKIKIDK